MIVVVAGPCSFKGQGRWLLAEIGRLIPDYFCMLQPEDEVGTEEAFPSSCVYIVYVQLA